MSKKNNEFSIEEYTSIRAELIERIKIMNSQEASALVAIITSWAAGFTFANEILTKKYLEKIEIVGTGNDGNSDFDVLDAIGKIEFPNDVRIKV